LLLHFSRRSFSVLHSIPHFITNHTAGIICCTEPGLKEAFYILYIHPWTVSNTDNVNTLCTYWLTIDWYWQKTDTTSSQRGQTRAGLRWRGLAATVIYRPVLSSERALQNKKPATVLIKISRRKKNWSWVPDGRLTPRHQDCLSVVMWLWLWLLELRISVPCFELLRYSIASTESDFSKQYSSAHIRVWDAYKWGEISYLLAEREISLPSIQLRNRPAPRTLTGSVFLLNTNDLRRLML
jgi:hypothetical protein